MVAVFAKGKMCVAGIVLFAGAAFAQENDTEKMTVLGSRVFGRTADQAATAIEVYQEDAIRQTGQSELGKVLQTLSPSFNFSATTVSDGTDIVRPATMRGMGPDQVLVLINGKRRHSQALLNVQQTVGRGSAGTDINAIPLAAIKRIEVLKQGAAAQYGSDAIAGVINIVLKDEDSANEVFAFAGRNYAGDGETGQLGASYALSSSANSFLRLSTQVMNRAETNRANVDERFDRQTMRIGEAKAEEAALFFNSSLLVNDDVELYSFGGYSERRGESGGFFREPDSDRNLATVYPEGFLPILLTSVQDASASVGMHSRLSESLDLDLSYTYGWNSFGFASKNSLNVSLGEQSPRSTENGTLQYSDGALQLELRANYDLGWSEALYVTSGVSYRTETYDILAGEPASWVYGPDNDPSREIFGQNGNPAPAGIQGFPGFQPANEVSAERKSYAVFLDMESYLTNDLLVALAMRYEDYESIGSATTGKASLRYDISSALAVRTTLATGFRVPSLAQVNYSSRSTTFAGDRLTETQTARQGSPAFAAIGLENLKNEHSLNQSLGFHAKPARNFNISADYYRIDVKDRIVLSEFLQVEASESCDADRSNCPIRQVLEPLNVEAVQFFTNAIDTKTVGLDLIADYALIIEQGLQLSWLAGYHLNQTKVEEVNAPTNVDADVIFSEAQTVLTEEGQPQTRYQLGMDVKTQAWHSGLRLHYYGEVSGAGFGNYKQTYGGKWLTDIYGGVLLASRLNLQIGANNLFDVYPDELNADHPIRSFAGGSFRYSWETAPFGYKGGFYYMRLAWNF
ncbi:MAG: TonB-dependent receptor plug domain-containing protein [Oligoflexus sp.]